MAIITGSDHTSSGMLTPIDSGYWSVLIAESVHLLGLFLSHTQSARNSRATAPLVDQFIRHLYILSKMPSQTGELLIFQSDRSDSQTVDFLGYRIAFGPIAISEPSPKAAPDQFMKVLSQGFRCLMNQGIHSIRLRIPDWSIEQAEQLRLALNIAARYRKAADTLSSITFRYFDRVITVPLVLDNNGRPDPNLTITAGLNGLSLNNARSLIRQADALWKLAQEQETDPRYPDDTYERLFSLRDLRTHLVKPLLEVNTCRQSEREITPIQRLEVDSVHTGQGNAASEEGQTCGDIVWRSIENGNSGQKLLDVVGADDYESVDAQEMARRLLYASKLLADFEKLKDPYPRIRLLHLLKEKYENAPGLILQRIKTLRRGLKIAGTSKALVIGLIHPDLLDLLVGVRERFLSADRCVAAESFGRAVITRSDRDLPALARRFKIAVDEIREPFNVLTDSHDADGAFNIDVFQRRIKERANLSYTFFVVLWYLFKCTFAERESMGYFRAVKHAAAKVSDKKRALRFLLADLLQSPFDVIASDRFALFFSNMLMRVNDQEGRSDNDFTPSDVLKCGFTGEAQHNAVFQLELNQVAVLTKMHTIHDRLKESLASCADETGDEESRSLLRLEREVLLFAALVGGNTARMILCGIFSQYEDLLGRISRSANRRSVVDDILGNLQIAVKGLQCVGQYSDLDFLRQLDNSLIRLKRFDGGIAYNRSIQRLIERITSAVKSIRLHSLEDTADTREQ